MNKDVLFLDVETPNGHNDRISSIGLIRCNKQGDIVARGSFLINPEEPFADINMRITGIRPCDVADSPTFPEIWRTKLDSFFDEANLVAHNATFDLSVLWKVFDAYGINTPDGHFCCTKRMAELWHPEFPNYKLPTVCKCLGFEMGKHHQALDDANACRRIFMSLLAEDAERRPEFIPYIPCHRPSRLQEPSKKLTSEKTLDYRHFLDLSELIVSDGRVSVSEAMSALFLIEQHDSLRNDPTIQTIASLATGSLADGDIDESESEQLVSLFRKIVDPCKERDESKDLEVDGRTFCLTGAFDHGPRETIAQIIEKHGGLVLKGVSKKCDYVVVGGQGSDAWATKNYGTKVKKALDLQSRGNDIAIVRESALPFW